MELGYDLLLLERVIKATPQPIKGNISIQGNTAISQTRPTITKV